MIFSVFLLVSFAFDYSFFKTQSQSTPEIFIDKTEVSSDGDDFTEEKPVDDPPVQPPGEDEIVESTQRTRTIESVGIISEFLSCAIGELQYAHNGPNTKYTGLFDSRGPDEWSAEFLAWCVGSTSDVLSVQLGGDMFPWSDSVTDCFLWFISHSLFDDSGDFTPWGGDYIFLDLNLDGLVDRMGVVIETKVVDTLDLYGNSRQKTYLNVICGNMPNGNAVELFEIALSDKLISGFGIIN